MGVALAAGGAVLVPAPGAHAATPEEIMGWCQRASVINGEQQQAQGGFADGFLADSCDYRQVGELQIYEGATQKVTPDFPNCEPGAAKTVVTASWSYTEGQRSGTYTATEQGAGGSLFDVLNIGWMKHKGSLDLTIKEGTVSDSTSYEIPPGKVLYIEFTPKLQRMNGEWQVVKGPDLYVAPEVTEGPHMLTNPSDPGKAGAIDGHVEAIYEDC